MPQIPGPRSQSSPPTVVRNVVQAITFLGAAIAISVTRGDPDLWGHVRFGQDLLRSWTLSSTDPYSFTTDRPWVNHEWLSEVIFALAYGVTGPIGLIALKLLIVASR